MLHEPSKDRIVPEATEHVNYAVHLLSHFEQLVKDAEEMDLACLDLVVGYIEEDDEFVDGSYVPELHLIVRRVDDAIEDR